MRLFTAAILGSLAICSPLYAADYRFVQIDVPRAPVTLAARCINARGDIAGNINDSEGRFHGYLRVDGKFSQVDYSGASFTFVYATNNSL